MTTDHGHRVEVALFSCGAGYVAFEVEGGKNKVSYPWPWEAIVLDKSTCLGFCIGCGAAIFPDTVKPQLKGSENDGYYCHSCGREIPGELWDAIGKHRREEPVNEQRGTEEEAAEG